MAIRPAGTPQSIVPAASFDLRLVAPFVAVAGAATFSGAAAELGMTAPALSERIGRLERELGARLVDRDGRRVALTAAGQRFLVEARTILDRAAQVAAALRAEPGTVRVHLSTAAASDELRAVIGRFAAEYPCARLTVSEGTSTEAAHALRHGDADVTFDYPDCSPAGVTYAVWNRRPFVLACHPTHRLAGRPDVGWSDLEGESVLVPEPGAFDGFTAALRAALARAGVRPREVLGPPQSRLGFVGPYAARGDAALIVPEWLYPALPPGFVCVPLTPVQEVEMGASWSAATTSPAVRGFVALIRSLSPLATAPAPGPEPVDVGS